MSATHTDNEGKYNEGKSAAVTDTPLRANVYSLLAALLRSPPRQDLLQRLRGIAVSETAADGITNAWRMLKTAADETDEDTLKDEFQALFIGLGRGEVLPYGSWYRTGYLMEKPLGDLRDDLAALGYERQSGNREPEDHAAALCEVMALLITDQQASFDVQSRFFDTHLNPWIERFFKDLENAPSARFYRTIACLGREFITLEKSYFSMLV